MQGPKFALLPRIGDGYVTWVAVGDKRQKYTASIERQDSGWYCLVVSDTGTGMYLCEGEPSFFDAAHKAMLFITENGGSVTFET